MQEIMPQMDIKEFCDLKCARDGGRPEVMSWDAASETTACDTPPFLAEKLENIRFERTISAASTAASSADGEVIVIGKSLPQRTGEAVPEKDAPRYKALPPCRRSFWLRQMLRISQPVESQLLARRRSEQQDCGYKVTPQLHVDLWRLPPAKAKIGSSTKAVLVKSKEPSPILPRIVDCMRGVWKSSSSS
eukprot:gb/GFBE01065046.1/.p1 GENE.gb/GFBE01065046.1/~~gb/GFBE01065046.1/.p1  ORF type:complete len:190 (+),score=37.68 gb/GFBE01065046.1/:1-570(+)